MLYTGISGVRGTAWTPDLQGGAAKNAWVARLIILVLTSMALWQLNWDIDTVYQLSPRLASAKCLEDAEFFVIRRNDFDNVLKEEWLGEITSLTCQNIALIPAWFSLLLQRYTLE